MNRRETRAPWARQKGPGGLQKTGHRFLLHILTGESPGAGGLRVRGATPSPVHPCRRI